MTEPCKQEGPIAELKAENRNKDAVLVAIQRTLEENTRLLQTVAEFGSDVRHMREDLARHDRDIDELYVRMRASELAPGQALSKVGLILISAGSSCVGALLVTMLTR